MSRYEFDDSAYIAAEYDARKQEAEADEHRDEACPECLGQSANCPFCCEGNRDADDAEFERIHARQAPIIRRKLGMP